MNQLLIIGVAVGIRLAFHFLGQLIRGAVVARVDFNGFAPIGNRVRGIASSALEQPAKLVEAIVIGSEFAGSLETLRCGIQISLAQRQHSPIRPSSRFTRGQGGHFGKFAFGVYIVAHLQCGQPDVESGNGLGVLLRGFPGKVIGRVARTQTER